MKPFFTIKTAPNQHTTYNTGQILELKQTAKPGGTQIIDVKFVGGGTTALTGQPAEDFVREFEAARTAN